MTQLQLGHTYALYIFNRFDKIHQSLWKDFQYEYAIKFSLFLIIIPVIFHRCVLLMLLQCIPSIYKARKKNTNDA